MIIVFFIYNYQLKVAATTLTISNYNINWNWKYCLFFLKLSTFLRRNQVNTKIITIHFTQIIFKHM